MKLIVGLGNPGSTYEVTRHNIGFMALDRIASYFNITFQKEKFQGTYCETIYNNEKIIFLKPLKYMNLSGEVVREYLNFFKISVEDLLIIHDDLDLTAGRIRLKLKGSSGGHNGLKDIERNLGTSEYKRIKIGISNDKTRDTKDYVLGKFSSEERDVLEPILTSMPELICEFVTLPFEQVMNHYNKK